MAVPSSGQLREYADIGVELGVAQTNVSLRGMSQTAGFSTPDAMSEFYGYSGECTTGVADVFGDGSGISLYQLDNNPSDASGNYNGTWVGTPSYTEGKIAAAANFDGSGNNYINTNCPLLWDNIKGNITPITVSAWVKGQGYGSNIGVIAMAGYLALMFKNTDGTVQIMLLSSTGGIVSTVTSSAIDNTNWHNIVGVFNYKTVKLYIDGQFIGEQTGTAAFSNDTQITKNILIGKWNILSLNKTWVGQIDQVRIFNKELSQSEVTSLYGEQICTNVVGSDNFNTTIYSGTNTTRSITGLGFQPDLVWIKARNSPNSHTLLDSLRGAPKRLFSNLANAEDATNGLISFDSDGFTMGNDSTSHNMNGSGKTYVAWSWKAGGAAVSAASIEATSATRSANPGAGFSIVKFQSSASTVQPPPMNYIEHGLNSAPNMVIYKRTDASQDWIVQHNGLTTNGHLKLNEWDPESGPYTYDFFDNTDTSIGVRSNYAISRNSPYIAYCFAAVPGYSSFGTYDGNTSTDGPVIECGFEPAIVIIKGTNEITNWSIYDNKRDTSNPRDHILWTNLGDAELVAYPQTDIDFNATNFQIRGTNGGINSTGRKFIYMAFAK